jgi:chemotaxis response regulator CheB
VYGMPKEAVRMGGVSETVPLQSIADRLLRSAAATDGSTA